MAMGFIDSIRGVVEYRGGKKRVPGVPDPTLYVDEESYLEAVAGGYCRAEDGVVTDKFRSEYADMFDRIGKIRQSGG